MTRRMTPITGTFNRRGFLAGTGTAALLVEPALGQVLINRPSTVYYVDNVSGNDSNSGRTPATAWKTVAKVNATVFSARDTVLFAGGQTFSGGGIAIGTANYSVANPPVPGARVTFGSYGTGRATISSTGIGFSALNVGCFTLKDLVFVGPSATANTFNGVYANNSNIGNSKLQSITFSNLDISLYGWNGIAIGGTGGPSTAGFNNVLISGCVVYNCTGGYNASDGSAGIYVYSDAGYGTGPTTPSHTNVVITGCTVHDCTGKAGDPTLWTGSGIFVGQSSIVTIQLCTAYNNGGNSTSPSGPVGIWFADVGLGVIQSCESYSNTSGNANDGIGFDLDGGCANCTIQYCYAHDNKGGGFLIYGYNDGITSSNLNSTVRYCISQNDGTAPASPSGAMTIGSDGATVTGVAVYGNTFYQSRASQPVVNLGGSSIATIAGHVANNIFSCTSGLKFIDGFATAGNPSSLLFTGNDYWTTGTFSLKWNTTTYTSFAAWQTATGQEKISGSNVGFTVDPVLTSPGGGGTIGQPFTPATLTAYQLQNTSPMLGVGRNMLTDFSINPGTQDFYNATIPNGGAGTGFNIGADSGTQPALQNFVTVQRGVSQASLQVLKPVSNLVTTEIAGGTGSGGVGFGNSYDLLLNDNNLNSRGGSVDPTASNPFWDNLFECIEGQWHTTFQATPGSAAGEVVTVITIDAKNAAYTPLTLAAAQALAPKLFADFVKGQRPFSLVSTWNTRIPYEITTYTAIAWPADTGFNYGCGWDQFSSGVYIANATDPVVTVTYPPGSWGNPGPSVDVRIPASTFTGSIAPGPGGQGTLTVTGSPTSPILLGMIVLSSTNGTTVGTRIVFSDPPGTGTGGAGTYTVDTSQTRASGTINAAVSGAVGSDGSILIMNGTTIHNFWQFVRTGLNTATSQAYAFCNAVEDTGWGTPDTGSGLHGAGIDVAGASELAGLLVQEETDQGDIKHALQIQVDMAHNLQGFVAPAIAGDGTATTNPPGILQTGQRLAIPPQTAMPGGLTPLGQKIFKCMVEYGCYITDSTGGVYSFRADPLGYDAATITALQADGAPIIRLLQRVT